MPIFFVGLDEWKSHLDSITSFGKIAVLEHLNSFTNPGLCIGDKQLIPLPRVERDALSIKEVCRQTPFGRDETVVDASIRKASELDHTQFKLTNPEWSEFFRTVVAKVSGGARASVFTPPKQIAGTRPP